MAPPATLVSAAGTHVAEDHFASEFGHVKPQRRAHGNSWTAPQSPASSDASPRALSPRAVMLPARASHSVVIEQQGMGKVVHKPDGTVVWEPAANEGAVVPPEHHQRHNLRQSMSDALCIGGISLGVMGMATGFLVATAEIQDAQKRRRALTTRQLTTTVANCVTATIAGTVTGTILGPLAAGRAVGAVLARPALLLIAGHWGVSRLLRMQRGVEPLLAKLASGDTSKILEALRHILAQAIRGNVRFAKEFHRLAGMEHLLSLLADALPDCPWLHLLLQALAELAKDVECREALVAAGGVPRLVALLRVTTTTTALSATAGPAVPPAPPSLASPPPPASSSYPAAVSGYALCALAALADHPLAQEAMREAGGVPRLVEACHASATALAAACSPSPSAASAGSFGSEGAGAPAAAQGARTSLLAAVSLLQALALDPYNKAAIGAAGGVAALLAAVRVAETKGELQARAVAALHNTLRGCPDNQRALAALPCASDVLRAALDGFGPCWLPAKADLHALLNVLARMTGAQESSGFVVIQGAVAGLAPKALTLDAAQMGPKRA